MPGVDVADATLCASRCVGQSKMKDPAIKENDIAQRNPWSDQKGIKRRIVVGIIVLGGKAQIMAPMNEGRPTYGIVKGRTRGEDVNVVSRKIGDMFKEMGCVGMQSLVCRSR